MKNENDVVTSSNVIEGRFKRASDRDDIPIEISHPASKNYPPESQAMSLLENYEELIESHAFRDDYIFHHDKKWDYRAEFNDELNSVVDKVTEQIKRIKEDTKRIKFYLDDL